MDGRGDLRRREVEGAHLAGRVQIEPEHDRRHARTAKRRSREPRASQANPPEAIRNQPTIATSMKRENTRQLVVSSPIVPASVGSLTPSPSRPVPTSSGSEAQSPATHSSAPHTMNGSRAPGRSLPRHAAKIPHSTSTPAETPM